MPTTAQRAGSTTKQSAGGGRVDGGHDDRVVEGGAGVLVGVEAAQDDVLHGVRDQAEAEGHQHEAHVAWPRSVPEEPKSSVHIGMPSARKPKAIGTMATAEVRRPWEMSSRTAPASPSAAEREMRGSSAAITETVMMACGMPQMSWALA